MIVIPTMMIMPSLSSSSSSSSCKTQTRTITGRIASNGRGIITIRRKRSIPTTKSSSVGIIALLALIVVAMNQSINHHNHHANHVNINPASTTRTTSMIHAFSVNHRRSLQSIKTKTRTRIASQQKQLILYKYKHSPSIQTRDMFLPPSGDDNRSQRQSMSELTSTIVSSIALILFFVSPLGAIFFTIFNSIIAFIILAPIIALTSYNIWEYFNTSTGTCPVCSNPVKVLNNNEGQSSICFNCGTILQVRDDTIYVANPNNVNNDNGENLSPMNQSNRNIFTTIMEELTSTTTTTTTATTSSRKVDNNNNRNRNKIIDVDIVDE